MTQTQSKKIKKDIQYRKKLVQGKERESDSSEGKKSPELKKTNSQPGKPHDH